MENTVYFGLTEDDFLGCKVYEGSDTVDKIMEKIDEACTNEDKRRIDDWNALEGKIIGS